MLVAGKLGRNKFKQRPQAGQRKVGKCPAIFNYSALTHDRGTDRPRSCVSAFLTRPRIAAIALAAAMAADSPSTSTSSGSRAARRTRPRKAGAAERAPAANAGASALTANVPATEAPAHSHPPQPPAQDSLPTRPAPLVLVKKISGAHLQGIEQLITLVSITVIMMLVESLASIIVRGYKSHAKMNYRIKIL